jgi:hypothetical protein
MEGEMAYLVLGEPTLADAPGGDRRGNREAEHIEEAGHERRHGESDIGEGGGGLVEGEGIDARNLSVLRHRAEGDAGVAGFVSARDVDGILPC